jgi:hypothetical protein
MAKNEKQKLIKKAYIVLDRIEVYINILLERIKENRKKSA